MKFPVSMERSKTQKGAVLIEFAFVAIFLIILFGCIVELSLLLYNKNVLDNASRVGARAAIVENALNNPENVEQKIIEYCSGRLVNLVDGRIEDAAPPAITINIGPVDGDIRVTVRYVNPFLIVNMIDAMLGLIGAEPIGLDDIPIQGETVMRPE
jgi:hypothetical protein